MSDMLLLGLFVVTVLLLARAPERWLGAATALLTLGLAAGLASLGGVERAQGALVMAALLGGGALVASRGALPRLGSAPRRKKTKTAPPRVPSGPVTAEVSLREYEVMERIGVGGMGSVYRARRLGDGRIVALKVPQEKYLADAKFVKRFYREAEVLRRLAHPGVVRVLDYKAEEGEHYIAMEYLDGETLERRLEAGALSFAESVQIARALAEALGHIHGQNIVHRDLKPANVMLLRGAFQNGKLREGGVKLMDFGIAVGKVLTRLTMTGARVGTPIYMAPEQAKGNKVDARSDVYSLGLLLYEMVTNESAFKGSYEAVVHQQVFETPRPPKQLRMEVPGKLSDLILQMIEKDPERRPSLEDIILAIDRGVLADDAFTDPEALALGVNDRQGALRLLDLSGRLRQSLRDLSAPHQGQANSEQGTLPAAPLALAADDAGHLYAALPAHRQGGPAPSLLRKLGADGRELLAFGRSGLGEGELLRPVSLCVGGKVLYVLDAETCFVSKFSLGGEYLGRFGGRGGGRGSFGAPRAVAAAPGGDVYVLDAAGREVQRFSPEGQYLSRLAFKQGRGGAELRLLDGLAVDARGAVYLGDAGAHKIRRIDPDGGAGPTFSVGPAESVPGGTFPDHAFSDAPASQEGGDEPWLIALDEQGALYCARAGGQTLHKFAPDGTPLATVDTYAPVRALALLSRGKVPA